MSVSLVCLNFHGIGKPERTLESGEAPYWISESFFRQVLDRVQAHPDPVHLTFDDGNVSDYTLALPALAERGLKASIFVLTGRIGQTGSLDETRIRELQAAGMEIGSHGIAHVRWNTLSPEALRHELVASRDELRELCGREVRSAGIPFGAYNARVLRALAAAGYEAVYSSDGGVMRPDSFLRPRVSIRSDMTLQEVRAILERRESPLRRMRRRLATISKRSF